MFSRQQQLRVLTLITLFVALAQASWFNSNPFRREVAQKKDLLAGVNSAVGGLAGGLLGSGSSSTPPPSSESSKSTSSSSSSSTPTPTPTPSISPTPSPSVRTPTPKDSSSSSTPIPTPTPTPTPSDNNSQSQVSVTHITVAPSQTSSSTASDTQSSSKSSNSASLAQNESSSSSTMSPKTKSTVIGVVVGIGGAIALGGLAIVAWRIWGRRKNDDDSDGLMGFRSGSAGHEKSNSSSGNGPANPFQSTLENYHNPAKNVNASSNF